MNSAYTRSGKSLELLSQQTAAERSCQLVMKDLGFAPNDIESLRKMEWTKLIGAGNGAVAKINPPGATMMGPGAPGKPRAGWSPCVDGKEINMRSFFDAAPEIAKNVPMLVGSVTEEGNRMSSRPAEEEWHSNLAKAYGDEEATDIVATLEGIPAKDDLNAAPAYAYYFTWQTPILD